MYQDKLDSSMCNDCSTVGDIRVTFKKFPDIFTVQKVGKDLIKTIGMLQRKITRIHK